MVRIHARQVVRSEELTYILKTAARSVLLATFIARGARRSLRNALKTVTPERMNAPASCARNSLGIAVHAATPFPQLIRLARYNDASGKTAPYRIHTDFLAELE
jgi:hypothetical protein